MSTENTTNKESAWRIWKGERELSYLHVSVMVLTFYINGLLFSYDAESVESLTGDEIKETTVSIAWRKEILYKNYLYILENVKQSCKENVINRKHRHRHTHTPFKVCSVVQQVKLSCKMLLWDSFCSQTEHLHREMSRESVTSQPDGAVSAGLLPEMLGRVQRGKDRDWRVWASPRRLLKNRFVYQGNSEQNICQMEGDASR